jgi:hypothetical protein
MSEESKPTLLSPSTYVPLTVIASAIIVTALVMSKLNAIENSIAEIRATSTDRWTATNMESWIDKTRVRNPALVLPAVEEIKRPNR